MHVLSSERYLRPEANSLHVQAYLASKADYDHKKTDYKVAVILTKTELHREYYEKLQHLVFSFTIHFVNRI